MYIDSRCSVAVFDSNGLNANRPSLLLCLGYFLLHRIVLARCEVCTVRSLSFRGLNFWHL